MNTIPLPCRRSLLCGVVLVLAAALRPQHALAYAAASAPTGNDDEAPKGKPPKDKDRDRDKSTTRLVVKVSGNGKPVSHADVKVKVGGGDGISLVTNDRGEASLTLNAPGAAEVHVIALGWASGRGVVELKAGEPTSLQIELKKSQ
ncbi:carboxypeptidase-like regulatory domain-containing protein [Pelomonas sp. Root1237]